MAGISLLMSKCSIPMYNNCPNSPMGRRTSKKVDIFPNRSSNLHLQSSSLLAATHLLKYRLYSSSTGNDGYEVSDIVGFDGNGFLRKVREPNTTREKVWDLSVPNTREKEVRDLSVPNTNTRGEKPKDVLWEYEVERCFWDATVAPVRFLFIFGVISLSIAILGPTATAPYYAKSAWSGTMFSIFWLLSRWKTNVLVTRMKTVGDVDREKLVTLDKIFSAVLFVPGCMALAKALFLEQFITVGGIGGVLGLLAAFVAGDILGNILSGLFVKVSQPFSIEDTIQVVGYAQGKVTEMGLTATSLLSAKKEPIKVQNSLFSSEVFVNKSLVGWRDMKSKIPMQIDDVFEKIPKISEEIMNMLKSNSIVFLGKEQPYCKVSRVEGSFVELSIGCNLKMMSKATLFPAEHDVLVQSVRIIKKHGATLTSKWGT